MKTPDLLRLLLEQTEDYALVLIDPRGTIIDWLAAATYLFGFTAEEIIGQPAKRLFTPEDIARGAPDHELAVGRAVGRAEDDRWQMRKDGTAFWASGVLLALHGERGELVAFAKILRDRTDVKTESEALENRARALAQQNERKDIFLGTLAHELRNPLAPLSNAVEVIRRTVAPDAMVEASLKMVERQVAAIRRLVDDLIDTARIGMGKIDLNMRLIELKDVALAAAEAARPLAAKRRQDLQVILIDGPVPVRADPGRLQQVFGNLLDNALKYTPAGGRIWLKVTTEGEDAVVRFEDTGVGMSADILPKVFDLFTQEESSQKIAPGGLGLGLPLVRDLVSLHGGTVQGRSEGRDKGSVFTVRLPMAS